MSKDFGLRPAKDVSALRRDRIPSGSLYLDLILGGGYVAGSSVELYGEPQTGKSLLAAKTGSVVSQGLWLPNKEQELNRDVGWWDVERQLDAPWLEKLGIDLEHLLVQDEFVFMEDALGSLVAAYEDRRCGLYVYDSVGASIAKKDSDKNIDEALVTSTFNRAKVMGVAMNDLVAASRTVKGSDRDDYNPGLVLFLNHSQVDMKASSQYFTATRSVGGTRLHHLVSTKLELWVSHAKEHRVEIKVPGIKDPIPVGQTVFFEVKKHRGKGCKGHTGHFRVYTMDCEDDNGNPHDAGEIDRVREIADILQGTIWGRSLMDPDSEEPVVKGAHYRWKDNKWHGIENMVQDLYEQPELRKEIEDALLALVK